MSHEYDEGPGDALASQLLSEHTSGERRPLTRRALCGSEADDADTYQDRVSTEALARRLVAHERWPGWRAGMHRASGRSHVGTRLLYDGAVPADWFPDLADHATQGCLLGMLEEAHLEGYLATERSINKGWRVTWRHQGRAEMTPPHATYGEALARALLAAWGAE